MIGALVVAVIVNSDGNRVDFFKASVLANIKYLTEDGCARLLIFGQYLSPKQGIAKGRLSSVEIARHQNFARHVLDSLSQGEQMSDAVADLTVQERGYGLLL